MASAETSSTEANGRNRRGQFRPGNKAGRGNPHARRVSMLRAAFMRCVTPDAMEAIVEDLVERAKKGDKAAVQILLQWTIGRPAARQPAESVTNTELAECGEKLLQDVETARTVANPPQSKLNIVRSLTR